MKTQKPPIKELAKELQHIVEKYTEDSLWRRNKEHDQFQELLAELKCFAAKRVGGVLENQVKNYENWNKFLEQEIARHKTCIKDLRGYISYLEKENENLEREKEQE